MKITSFDKLQEVRSVARARAVEDFAYFAGAVLGVRLPAEHCLHVQRQVELHGVFTVLPEQQKHADAALLAWLTVLGLREGPVRVQSETFEWLFPEHASQRAA